MKQVFYTLLAVVVLLTAGISVGSAQVAPEKNLTIQAISAGSILVGQNSTDSKVGPFFGGSLAYGLPYGISLYVGSGYGYTNYQSVDGLKLVSIPILGGVTYNIGSLLNSSIVQPFVGVAGGAFDYTLRMNDNTVTILGVEQKTTSFGLEGVAGVSFSVAPQFAIDVHGTYDHVFSKRDNGNLLETQEWNNVSFGGGVSYSFSIY
jgi:hypothetical protein